MTFDFFDVLPSGIENSKKVKEKKKKKKNKIEAESFDIIQQKTNFSKLWYSLKSSLKVFKPYHYH